MAMRVLVVDDSVVYRKVIREALAQIPRVVVLVPGPFVTHEIGSWADDDLICVALPVREQLYITRRCVPMGTIRAVILQTQRAGAADSTPAAELKASR